MLEWFREYRAAWLRPDLLAGLITAAVVIPKAMAHATVAGLPVQVGLYTAFVPMVIYAVLGSSRVLSVSTTSTVAILVGAGLAVVAPDGDPARVITALVTLTVVVGLLLATGRPAAARLPGQLHLRAGAHWLQGRHWPGHRAGSAAKAPGRAFHQGHVRREPAVADRQPAADVGRDADGGRVDHRPADRRGTFRAAATGALDRRGCRHRRHGVSRARLRRRGNGGRDSPRVAAPAAAGPCHGGATVARCPGHCAHELHGDGGCRTRLCSKWGTPAARQSRVAGDGGRDGCRRVLRRHACRGRDLPDRCQPAGRRVQPAGGPGHRRGDAADDAAAGARSSA